MTLPMLLMGGLLQATGGGGKLVQHGTPTTYSNQVSAMSLTAANVFAGGIVFVQAVNRGGTTIPPTPSGWTLLASGSSASISKALFARLTPISEAITCSLGAVNYSGGIWSMKFEDGSPIQNLRLDGTATANIGSPGSTVNTIPRAKKPTTKPNRFAISSLYMKNDSSATLSFSGLEAPALVDEIFTFASPDDRHVFNVVSDASSIQNDGGGSFNSTGSGLTSANAYAHYALEVDLNPLPPGALKATYRQAHFSSTQNAVGVAYTFNSPITDPGVNRYVVICIGATAVAGTNVAPTITEVLCDGVPLTALQSWGITPGSGMRTAIYGGYVNTANTTVPISIKFGATATRGLAIAVYTVIGAGIGYVDSEVKQYNNTGCNFKSYTLVEDTDCWIGFGHHFGNTATFGWTGATEQNELNYSSGARTSSALLIAGGASAPRFTSASAGDGLAAAVQLRGA